ncbi:prepilin-type N-terminal cleavage/methylation domain-containing protein [Ornithinibacillus sp. JPR2-1]|uniref:type IV pilus modification PilV family protein n=1 Tax=Ornithinibacillus sp. JPR2-1 TaxID=2094019 RepID=UPI0031D5D076
MKCLNDWYRNESGLTLVELLVSFVLITLILTTFITFFVQSATMTTTSETIIDATYIAQAEMENLYSASSSTKFSQRENAITDLGYVWLKESEEWTVFTKELDGSNYIIHVRLHRDEVEANMTRVIVEVFEEEEDNLQAKMESVVVWGEEDYEE